jgi:hypothetical protein
MKTFVFPGIFAKIINGDPWPRGMIENLMMVLSAVSTCYHHGCTDKCDLKKAIVAYDR